MGRNHNHPANHILVMLILLVLTIGCSSGNSDSIPTTPSSNESERTSAAYENNHVLWAYGLIDVDPSTLEVEVIPVRDVQAHWNVLQFLEQWPCNDCFRLSGVTVNPDGTLDVDVTIRHPFLNPNLTGFDVRGIAMFSGSHSFPVSGLNTSDHTAGDGELLNADGYTTLYNPSTIYHGFEGYIRGRLATESFPNSLLNGFRRFVSDDPANTRNAFYAGDEITVTYHVDMPDAPNPWIFGYAIDACWAPPINKPVENPITDFSPEANCPETWKIEVEDLGPRLDFMGGSTKLQIDVYDWQGKDDTHPVRVECPDLFNGTIEATWKLDEDEYTRYELVIENADLMPTGRYFCLISKEAQENEPDEMPWLDLTAYQVFEIKVGWPDGYPKDVTPPWVSLRADEVETDGNYLYVGSFYKGLDIFDISDPLNFIWLKQLPVSGHPYCVTASGGYAYIAAGGNGLLIYDVDPPESAFMVRQVDCSCRICRVPEPGEYAYVGGSGYLTIVDINPLEDAHVVNTVHAYSEVTNGFAVSEGYAYVPVNRYIPPESFQLNILDVDPPESAYVVNSCLSGPCYYVDALGHYVFMDFRKAAYLKILDVTDPESPTQVAYVGIDGRASAFSDSGDYAYVADWSTGLHIVDIDPIESANVVKTVELPIDEDIETDVAVSNGYAYYADNGKGLYVIDIDPPESAEVVNTVGHPIGTYEVAVSGDYAYVAGRGSGLQIIDITTPESARITESFPIGSANGIAVLDGYAYVSDYNSGLQIADIDPTESAHVINTVNTPSPPEGVDVTDGYAFVADGESGLLIIDIDPPELAHIVNSVFTPLAANNVAVSEGYAYVTDDNLEIIDIDPPGSAHIVNSITIGSAWEIAISGGYAYVGGNTHALRIIDIDPPESAHIVNAVETSLNPLGIAVSGDYAYVSVDSEGVLIYDINPPESACLLKSFGIPNNSYDAARDVAVAGNYLYVTCPQSGLWIFKLW